MTDDPPVAYADLRALFELLDGESGKGYRCDHKFPLTRQFLAKRKLPEEDTLRWLGENGAGCDCEVIFNVEQQWGERASVLASSPRSSMLSSANKPQPAALAAERQRRWADLAPDDRSRRR